VTEYLENCGVSDLGRKATIKLALLLLAEQAVDSKLVQESYVGNLLTDKKSHCMRSNRLIIYQHYKLCFFEYTAGSTASDIYIYIYIYI
jgi:hypothetical protein